MNAGAYLLDAIRGFQNYKTLGDEAMAQVPADADFDTMLDADSNSIAVIVQHIAGNFRSRYRDFLTVLLIVKRANVFPDNWLYIHTPRVHVGRIQNFKNWSLDMVPNAGTTSLGVVDAKLRS